MKTLTLWGVPALYIFIGIAFILPKIPIIGKFFNVINTGIHELGHALVALAMDGKVKKIEIFNDTSGATTTQCKSKTGGILVSLAGYPFAAIFSYAVWFLYDVGYEKGIIWGLSILFVFMLIFWIRNWYGFFWIIIFCGINGYLIYLNDVFYMKLAALFYACTLIMESVSSSFVILYLSIVRSQNAGDTTLLKKLTAIPAFIWGIIFLGITGLVTFFIVKNFILPSLMIVV